MFSQGCQSRRFSFNATVLAWGIHRSLRKMNYRCGLSAMQNDRERKKGRERERQRQREPEWVVYKKYSDCIHVFFMMFFFIYMHRLKMAQGTRKLLKKHFLLFQKSISQNLGCFSMSRLYYVVFFFSFFGRPCSLIETGEMCLCGSDEVKSLSRSRCGFARQQEADRIMKI